MVFPTTLFRAVVLPVAGLVVAAAASFSRADVMQILILTDETVVNGNTANPVYEQTFDLSGAGINSVSVTEPGGGVFSLGSNGPGDWQLHAGPYTDLTTLQAQYPQGSYTFAIQNSDGSSDSVSLAFNAPQPVGMAALLSPADGATGVPYTSAPTFLWNPVPAGNAFALGCQLQVDNGDTLDQDQPYDIGNTSWTPAVAGLQPSTTYDFLLSMYQVGSLGFDQTTDGGDPFTYYGVLGTRPKASSPRRPNPVRRRCCSRDSSCCRSGGGIASGP